MKTYSVYIAPITKDSSGKIRPNGAKHWERIGSILSKNKKLALKWLKENQVIEKGFVFVIMQFKD
jgi:hypothetical protein